MDEQPKTSLETQIEQEAKELREAPVIPPQQWIGSHRRCHICGQVGSEHNMETFDHHVVRGGRLRCPRCSGG